jgi:hypothetical protein
MNPNSISVTLRYNSTSPSITNPFEYGKYREALRLKQSLKSSAHQLDICIRYSVHCVSCSIIDEEMNFLFTAKWLWYLIDCEERNYIVSYYTTLKIMLEFSIVMYTFVKKKIISLWLSISCSLRYLLFLLDLKQ